MPQKLHIKIASVPGQERSLFDRVVRLAYTTPELRPQLLPMLKDAARSIGLNTLKDLHEYRGTFAILSAYRPMSKSDNKARHGELIRDLQVMGYRSWFDAKGYWTHTEKSVMVPRMTFGHAVELGRKYNQDAVVYKGKDGLVGIYDLRTNTVQVAGPNVDISSDPADAVTKFRNTGLTYELSEAHYPFSGPMTQDKLRSMQ
jgi:hypothetical protein